jgi:PAS domain S-box-containing protein
VNQFDAYYDDSPFGVFRADRELAATYANEACRGIFALRLEEFLGHAWLNAIHAADRPRVLAAWRAACADKGTLDISFRTVRPDGSRRYLRVRSRVVPAAETTRSEYVAVVLDMTEQVLAERRLRRNNELLSAVLQTIPCGVTVFDADGSLVLDNQKSRCLLSVPDDAPASVISDFGTLVIGAPASGAASYPDTGAPLHSGFDPTPRVREEVQADGRVLEVRDAPMPTGGTVTTFTDITEHKNSIETLQQAKAAAEQAAAAKQAFLAAMSHEIRTPLNGLIGMTNILLDTPLNVDQHQIVEVIRHSGESLLVVVNDILDYSKIESGQMELERLPLRLQEVVDNSVRLLAAKAHEKNVELAVDVDAAIPPLILGDRTRLQQVLVNLISNAVKFTQEGHVHLRLAVADREAGRGEVGKSGDLCEILVCIEDTGVGIAADKLESIFDPFVQGDSSTARRYGGTGLGLAIAKRLVEAMGGSIEIRSELGAGTTVCFSFLAETAVPRSRVATSTHAPLWGKHVLLVRGSRSDTGVLVTKLRRWGLQIQPCHGAPEALSRLAGGERYDLMVVATHHLVDPRGVEFVQQLRNKGLTVPAVLLARSKRSDLTDPAKGVWTLPRTSSESTLYDALLTALQGSAEVFADRAVKSQFDDSLGQLAPLRILVAEDNEVNRKVVLRMLAGFGYTADVAHNGAEVIDAVKRQPYDLVLMDIEMPVVDGIEATKYIIDNLSPKRRPRVVAMSANVMREHVDATLAAGADQYIGKPFAPSELRKALEQCAQRNAPRGRVDPQSQPSAGLLSLERIRRHLDHDGKGEFLHELAEAFAAASKELLVRLANAVRAEHGPEARALVHEYSGMCAVVGAEKLTQLLLRLQVLANEGRMKEAALLVTQCHSVQAETIAALEAFVRQHQAEDSRGEAALPVRRRRRGAK